MKMCTNLGYKIARTLEIIIGLYFIGGVIPKILDVDKFAVQMAAYKVIEAPFLLESAVLFTVFVEFSLGTALILALRFKGLTILALECLTITFSGLILYAWLVHGLQDCGCFPIIKMSPPVSLFKNAIIVVSGGYILWQMAGKATSGGKIRSSIFLLPVLKIAVILTIAVPPVVFAWHSFDQEALNQEESGNQSIFAQFEVFTDQGYFNLAEGVYLVAVMSSTCPECKKKVPELNDLYFTDGMPPLIALCYEEAEGDLETFRSLNSPVFPTHSLGSRALLYFNMIEKEPFRLVLLYDGNIIASWDGYVPPQEEIIQKVEQINLPV
jgi:hypothetical protein